MTRVDNIQIAQSDCHIGDLAAYIDGELEQQEMLAMEQHLAACYNCRVELNLQKRFLGELNIRLGDERLPEPPANFAKVIAANAEGTVSGLNSWREGRNALWVVAVLAMLTLSASVFASGSTNISLVGGVEKCLAVISAVSGILHSLLVGFMVLVRSFAVRFPADIVALIVVPAGVLAIISVFDRLRSDDRRG